jgi:predicted GNAT superfamily acetyltransferase
MPATPSDIAALADDADAAMHRLVERLGIRIARLNTVSQQDVAVRLFCQIWGVDTPDDLIAPSMLRALDFAGNYVIGAYDGEVMVGASVAFFGEGHLHSHMTGVSDQARASGTGLALKQHQRAWALRRGITSIEWTFDPLVARNAYFNLQKLGAEFADYLPEFYGVLDDNLNRGDVSDRALARWDLTRGGDVAAMIPGTGDRLVEVPGDIEALRQGDPGGAARWRLRVREEILAGYAEGYRVAGITRDGRYVLRTGQ